MSQSGLTDYYGFELYFPVKCDQQNIVLRVSAFEAHLQSNISEYSFAQIEKEKYFLLDFTRIINDKILNRDWPSFDNEVESDTEFCLKCVGLAMHYYINKQHSKSKDDIGVKHAKNLPIIRPRLINYHPILPLKDVKANCYGKLIAVQGTVIKASPVKIICDYMAFSCGVCKDIQVVKQVNNCYTVQYKCQNLDCRSKTKLEPLHNSASTRTVNWQSIKLQQSEYPHLTFDFDK